MAVSAPRSLSETPLPRLLVELHQQAFSGSLTLSRDRVGKRFLFREGIPIFAESTLPSESLGVQLMDAGKLSREQYSQVVAHVQRSGCKEGRALLELGMLDARGLFLALKEQVRLRLVECFGWPQGEYYTDDGSAPPPEAQPFRTDLYALLQEGIETHWSADRTLGDLQPHMGLFPRRSRRFERVAPRLRDDDAVRSLFDALDGTLTLWKAVQLARTPRALAAAWVLDATGALDYREKPLRRGVAEVTEPELEIHVSSEAAALRGERARAQASSSSAQAPTSDPAAERLAEEIRARHDRLAEADHYELLGLAPESDAAAIKRVYLKAAKTYHPDALARSGLDAATRALASKVFAEIGKAYAVLSNPQRRAEYDQALRGSDADLDVNALAQAETLYRKGEVLLRQGNFRAAFEFLRPAVELWPDEAAYQSALGWVLYKKLPSEPESACEHLERATEMDGNDPIALFRLGVVLRALGEGERAASALARAKQLDPKVTQG